KPGRAVVPPAESRRRRVDAGSAAAVGLAGAEVGDLAGAVGNGAEVLRQQRASDGVSGVPRRGLAHRQRGGGKRLQNGGRPTAQGSRHALGGRGSAHAVSRPRLVPQRERPMASLLGSPVLRTVCSASSLTLTRSAIMVAGASLRPT